MTAQKQPQQWTTQEKKDQNKQNEVNPSDQSKNQQNPAQSNQGGLKTEKQPANDTDKPLHYTNAESENERSGGMKGEGTARND